MAQQVKVFAATPTPPHMVEKTVLWLLCACSPSPSSLPCNKCKGFFHLLNKGWGWLCGKSMCHPSLRTVGRISRTLAYARLELQPLKVEVGSPEQAPSSAFGGETLLSEYGRRVMQGDCWHQPRALHGRA